MSSYSVDNWFLGKERSIFSKNNVNKDRKGLQFKSGTGLKNIQAAGLKKPEVMVKIPTRGSSKSGLKAAASHLDYISRNGKLTLENQDGEKITGKADIKNLVLDQWGKLGIAPETKYKETLNVVLSMPPETDPLAVKNAARDFAKEVFKGHQYVFVEHTDEKHPHVHICVTMRDELGKKMNPRKNDLFQWRVKFAEKMREHGVDCAATKRQHRGVIQKGENGIVRHITKRGGLSTVKQQEVQGIIEAIKNQEKPSNPFIKKQLETRGFVVDEYRQLARVLYMDGMKKEAKIISDLAKISENQPTETRLQNTYNNLVKNDRLDHNKIEKNSDIDIDFDQ